MEEPFEISDKLAQLFAEQDSRNSARAERALDDVAEQINIEELAALSDDDTKVWKVAESTAPRAKRRHLDLSDLKFGDNYSQDD